MRIPLLVAILFLSTVQVVAADGEESYRTQCAVCHGGDAPRPPPAG
ncbi:MAG: cytochrome c [Acidobacteria bacterium]|nr:cytochrome c [Acidobacteriota bacterium]